LNFCKILIFTLSNLGIKSKAKILGFFQKFLNFENFFCYSCLLSYLAMAQQKKNFSDIIYPKNFAKI
jgi:hypothetical protein